MRAPWGWFAILVAPTTTACGTVLGDWFTDYSLADDAGSGEGGADSSNGTGSLNGCTPNVVRVSNEIRYPSTAQAEIVITGADEQLDTTNGAPCINNVCCVKNGTNPAYCTLVAGTFRIVADAKLHVTGDRPLVIVTANELVIEGVLDVAGADATPVSGPGVHPKTAPGFGGGGGSIFESGEGSCGVPGGPKADLGLFAGGQGGGGDSGNVACRNGGGGGGAVQLVSLCRKIVLGGEIRAGGGAGGGTSDPACLLGGAGGGGGGTVWLQAPGIDIRPKDEAGREPNIIVTGGGGGGGACRPDDVSAWTPGGRGDGFQPGEGGSCINGISGGAGGAGGSSPNEPPGAGGVPVPGTGQGRCGGGGGARGHVVLQVAGRTNCEDPPVPIFGTCQFYGQQ